MSGISVIITVDNDQFYLEAIAKKLLINFDSKPDFEIIFVDNASEDLSGVVLEDLLTISNKIKIKRFENKFEICELLREGFKLASYDAVMVMGAHYHHPVDCVNEFVDKYNSGADFVYSFETPTDNPDSIKKVVETTVLQNEFPTNISHFWLAGKKVFEKLKSNLPCENLDSLQFECVEYVNMGE